MDKLDIIKALRDNERVLRGMGVSSLSLYGSAARDEAKKESDVDLFFDYDDPRFSLIEFIDVKEKMTSILGREADLVTRNSLHPELRYDIEQSAIRIF